MSPSTYIFAALFILSASGASASTPPACEFSGTVRELLQNKDQHDRKIACVTGSLRIEFEGDQLSWGESKIYLNFYKGPDYTDESVARDRKRMKEFEQKFQGRCIVVRGRFDLKDTGHFGMWPAALEFVDDIVEAAPASCG